MFAIYKRELKAFFQSMIGWIYIAATMFLTGIYFIAINLTYGSSNVANTVSSAAFIYILTIPILSMRILSEERKQKTDQMVLTAPISVGKIVMGKYLAMATVVLLPVIVICAYPLILSAYGTVAFGESYVAILGFFLYGLAALAVGMFLSSLTESQVIAAVLTFGTLFVTYMMQGITSMITGNANVVTAFIAKILSALDFSGRFDSLTAGSVDLGAVIYFISVIVICLFLTTQSIQKRRYSISVKNIRMGAYSTGLIVIVLVAVVLVNLIVTEVPVKYTALDVTKEKIYSLSDQTKEFAENLTQDIQIYVLQDENNKDEVLDETLQKYEGLSKHIKVTYKNPVESPNFYKQYTDGNITMNSLIVESDKRYKVVDYSNIYETEVDYSTYQQNTTGYDGEGQITSALDYVTRENMKKAYVLEGHDEVALDQGFQSALEKLNLTSESLNLLQADAVPEDAAFVMVMSPSSDFSADDANKLIQYAKDGGKLMITTALIEDTATTLPNFQKVLDYFGVTIVPGMIVETNSQYYTQEPTYLLPEVQNTYFTDGVYENKYAFMPYAQGIRVAEADDVSTTSILSTSDQAYSKMDISNATSYDKAMGDEDGPFDVGVYVEKTLSNDTTTGLFVFSSVNFFTDNADSMVSNANQKIFSNCVSEFNSDEEAGIVIPVKSYQEQTLTISSANAAIAGILLAIVIPIGLVIAGFVIWMNRRKR